MLHSRRVGIFIVAILLTACQASLVGPQQIELTKLGVRFTYPDEVIQREQNAEYLLKTARSHMFASSFSYKQKSAGIGDWTITPKIRETLLATKTCDILKDNRVFLPVNTRKTMHCDVIRADEEAIIVTAVGYGVPDAAMDFLESMIVLLRPKDFIVVTGITPFPITDDQIGLMTAGFPLSRPDLPVPLWPNRGFHFLAIDVRAFLETQLNPASAEVTANRDLLKAIAKSVTLTDAVSR
jgi:hypothetical protein